MSFKIGIGFRRSIAEDILLNTNDVIDFVEIAPENWMSLGGYWGDVLNRLLQKHPISMHGLSLSIGSPDTLDFDFLKQIKEFISSVNPILYSEHLSYSKCDNAHLYDLLPIPFTLDAINHIVNRIQTVQDVLGIPIALENVSYYTPLSNEITESDFISQIILKSGCNLLLDVNNVFVNAFNHNYDPKAFIDNLPLKNVSYIHIAGHEKISDDTIIDTHGHPVIEEVYDLLKYSVDKLKSIHNTNVPILLERDFNISSLEDILEEAKIIKKIIQ